MRDLGMNERRDGQLFCSVVALAVAVFISGAPVVEAAVSKVRLAGGQATAKIKSTDGGVIESKPVGRLGVFEGKGSPGAVDVRDFPGGVGILGAGDCTASTEPAQGPLANVVAISPGNVISDLIVTGTGTIRVTSAAIGGGAIPLANFVVNAESPNAVVPFANGLKASKTTITFTGIDGTACNFLILGVRPAG
ncbi:MAG: hypothetical protein M3285_13010 [Actinomycetota bacterium]|nr:hypothetical protein [Actinomycetota bacterium]